MYNLCYGGGGGGGGGWWMIMRTCAVSSTTGENYWKTVNVLLMMTHQETV